MLAYRVMRLLSRWFLRILHPGLMVEGTEHIDATPGPIILAGNHPNTLVDPLIQGIHFKRRVHFMANAGLFANPFMDKFLRFAGVIPIARRGIDGAAGRKVDNNKSFAEAYALFEAGGIMFVAPEGGSYLSRRLRRPLKTGTARMAFAAESANDWSLDLRVLPAGGNYFAPTAGFTPAYVRFGPTIRVADWREAYEENPRQAIRSFTAAIGDAMAALLIDTKDKTEERCLRPIDRLVQNDAPLLTDAHLQRVNQLLAGLRTLDEETYETLCQQSKNYETLLKRAGIDDAVLSDHPSKKGPLGLWLGLPLFLYGAINHLPLIFIVEKIWGALKIDTNYAGTVRGLTGTILLPIFYLLQSWLLSFWIGGWAWLYFFTLFPAGLFALAYYTTYRPFWATVFGKRKVTEEMTTLRSSLKQYADTWLNS